MCLLWCGQHNINQLRITEVLFYCKTGDTHTHAHMLEHTHACTDIHRAIFKMLSKQIFSPLKSAASLPFHQKPCFHLASRPWAPPWTGGITHTDTYTAVLMSIRPLKTHSPSHRLPLMPLSLHTPYPAPRGGKRGLSPLSFSFMSLFKNN